jgi:hypothetical protein
MEFQSASPSAVKAIRQRDLLNTWLRLYIRAQSLPTVTEYEPSRLKEELNELVYYEVDAVRVPPLFVIQSEGTRLASAYGATGKGRQLDEYVGFQLAPVVLPAYHLCVARQLPVYTIDELEDAGGHPVEYERLLLPFGNSGMVTQIIASLKTISIDGGFQMRDLIRGTKELPRPMFRAVIDRDLLNHLPNLRSPAADLEFE